MGILKGLVKHALEASPQQCHLGNGHDQRENYSRQEKSSPQSLNSYLVPVDGPLPLPVIIPQQRPGSTGRGFMSAYAPSLETCGIDQKGFTHFIEDINTGFKGNKALAGLQVVCLGVGFAPSAIAMGVSMLVSAGAKVANNYHVQHKINIALDKYNAELFSPRGLFAMTMKYEPVPRHNSDKGARLKQLGGVLNTLTNGHRAGNSSESSWTRDYTSGTSHNVNNLPTQAAPLVYIDDRHEQKQLLPGSSSLSEELVTSSNEQQVGNKASRAFGSFNNYLDQRARVRYAAENGGDVLALLYRSQGIGNCYLGPNHMAANNSLIRRSTGHIISYQRWDDKQGAVRSNADKDKSRRNWIKEWEKNYDDKRNIFNNWGEREKTEDKVKGFDEDYHENMGKLESNRKENKGKDRKDTLV